MTDKQITSNDYIFELNEMCIDCISEIDECECRKIAENLHFKLYLKEQECETLKAEYTRVHTQLAAQEAYILVDGEEVWRGSTRKLKQENEKLKAENEELKYKAEFFENYNNAHINKITKLEKTLTEIKELCQKHIKAEKIVMANDILQKISECEGNNDLEN